MISYKYNSRNELPTELASYYVEKDGSFFLDAEGVVDNIPLEEIRTSNLALTKERDELRLRFDGIDPDEVRKLAEEKRKLEEAQQLKDGEYDKVVETRVKTLRSELEKQITKLASERDSLHARLSTVQIDQGILTAATKRKLLPTALPDITARARAVFKLVDGMAAAFDSDGKRLFNADGVTPLSLEEWVNKQVVEAPHLFNNSAGGATADSTPRNDGNSGADPSMKNPFTKKHWNLTEQMRLQ